MRFLGNDLVPIFNRWRPINEKSKPTILAGVLYDTIFFYYTKFYSRFENGFYNPVIFNKPESQK